jgi:hypothetical protein
MQISSLYLKTSLTYVSSKSIPNLQLELIHFYTEHGKKTGYDNQVFSK